MIFTAFHSMYWFCDGSAALVKGVIMLPCLKVLLCCHGHTTWRWCSCTELTHCIEPTAAARVLLLTAQHAPCAGQPILPAAGLL